MYIIIMYYVYNHMYIITLCIYYADDAPHLSQLIIWRHKLLELCLSRLLLRRCFRTVIYSIEIACTYDV